VTEVEIPSVSYTGALTIDELLGTIDEVLADPPDLTDSP